MSQIHHTAFPNPLSVSVGPLNVLLTRRSDQLFSPVLSPPPRPSASWKDNSQTLIEANKSLKQ